MYSKAIFSALIMSLLASSTFAQINWVEDLDTAKQLARTQQKPILLHFSAEWCGPCQQLERFVFSSEQVGQSIESSVIPMLVDVDLAPSLVERFGVTSIPVDIVILPDETIVHQAKSPKTTSGYLAMLGTISKSGARVASTGNREILEIQRQISERARTEVTQQAGEKTFDFGSSDVDFRPANDFQNDNQFAPKHPTDSLTDFRGSARFSTPEIESPEAIEHEMEEIDFVLPTEDPRDLRAEAPSGSSSRSTSGSSSRSTSGSSSRSTSGSHTRSTSGSQSRASNALLPQTNQLASAPKTPQMKANPFVAAARTSQSQSFRPDRQPSRVINEMINQSDREFEAEVKVPRAPVAPLEVQAAEVERKVEMKQKTAGVALSGNCPVSLLTKSEWVPGDSQFGCIHRGRTYVFASESNLHKFLTAPDDFSPMLAGYDPVDFHDRSQLVTGKESLGVFMSKSGRQKVVLFSSMENQKLFKANPKKYLDAVRVATEQVDGGMIR